MISAVILVGIFCLIVSFLIDLGKGKVQNGNASIRGGNFLFITEGGGGDEMQGTRESIMNERGEGDGSDYPLTGFLKFCCIYNCFIPEQNYSTQTSNILFFTLESLN